MRRVLAVALVVLAAGACTRAGDEPTVSTTTTSTRPTTTTAALATPPVSAPGPAERAHLTAVRAAAAGDGSGGSRVVFEFDPVVPGYGLDYVRPPVTEDGSGTEIPVQGAALLQVRMTDADTARIVGEKVVPTYTGPRRVSPVGGGGVVTEVVDAGDFEGQVTWVIGLTRTPAGVRVSTLSGPSRLVIDVPGPA